MDEILPHARCLEDGTLEVEPNHDFVVSLPIFLLFFIKQRHIVSYLNRTALETPFSVEIKKPVLMPFAKWPGVWKAYQCTLHYMAIDIKYGYC